MSFADREAPPPPAGETLSRGIRSSILTTLVLARRTLNTGVIWTELCRHQGFGDVSDAFRDIRERWGTAAAGVFADTYETGVEAEVDDLYATLLQGIPDALFLTAIERALHLLIPHKGENLATQQVKTRATQTVVAEVNGLFERRGVHYRIVGREARWHGDAGAHRAILRPALDSLADGRFAGPRAEFEAALQHLRAGTPKEYEDAVDEAAKSVESAMKSLLGEKGIPMMGNEAARPLWNLIDSNKVVPPYMEWTLLAPSRIRNRMGGHGSGREPRAVAAADATACVQSAATAITYLASVLTQT